MIHPLVARLSALALFAVAACTFPPLPVLDDAGAGPDADLARPQPLTVTVAGEGTVRSDPAGIDCGAACSTELAPLTPVTLEATPASTSVFLGWEGDCAGTGPCALTMDGAKRVTARFARHGSARWVRQLGLAGDDAIEDVAVDAAGNLLVAGTVDDGNGADLFVAKYAAADGAPLWERRFATSGFEMPGGIATDADGNAYVAARLQGAGVATYDGRTLAADPYGNVIVLRFAAATGAVEWAKQWGGMGVDYPGAVAVAGSDLYVVGYSASDPSRFDDRSFAGQTGNGFVVRAATATGTVAALKHVTGSVSLRDVAVNGAHVAVAGSANGTAAIDAPCTVTTSGSGQDLLVFDLLAADLDCQWSSSTGDSVNGNDASATAVAPLPSGGWIVGGAFEGTIPSTGGLHLTSRGGFDIVLARHGSDGQRVWAFRYGDTASELVGDVATPPSGGIVLTGSFDGTVAFGGTTVTGTSNVFVTRVSPEPTPTHEWSVSLGGADFDAASGVALAPDGTIALVARFSGMTTVGDRSFASSAGDAWIASLVP